ncbi:hypothetical protein Goshw_003599 [Gossypium schwendimanii]|uniref:Uncharacterized protein n=1 Tax=Gossypium schwendimanii TaxID=34291 RepID=A0A7J9L155_GOSSC|nr:hypothetical protein [Gossypium schwendimanii]
MVFQGVGVGILQTNIEQERKHGEEGKGSGCSKFHQSIYKSREEHWRPLEAKVGNGFMRYPVENAQDPTTVKARAYLQAVTFGEEIGFSDAVVEGNALKRLSFKHTSRTLKGAAHVLAARGRRYNVLIFWMEEVPPEVEPLITNGKGERRALANEMYKREMQFELDDGGDISRGKCSEGPNYLAKRTERLVENQLRR